MVHGVKHAECDQQLTRAHASVMLWCPCDGAGSQSERPPDSELPLAVIGILSFEGRRSMRDASRATWLGRTSVPGLLARFVLRGLHLVEPTALNAESDRHHDILLVNASSRLARNAGGPMQSLFLWLRVTLQATCLRAHY